MRHFMKNGEWSMRLTLSELLQSEDIELYAINISRTERERMEEIYKWEGTEEDGRSSQSVNKLFPAKGRFISSATAKLHKVKTV